MADLQANKIARCEARITALQKEGLHLYHWSGFDPPPGDHRELYIHQCRNVFPPSKKYPRSPRSTERKARRVLKVVCMILSEQMRLARLKRGFILIT